MLFITPVFALLFACCGAQYQAPPDFAWTIDFNSSYKLSASQIAAANLTDLQVNNIEVSLNFERSNWANGSVEEDSFYTVPSNASTCEAGSLLKAEIDANTSAYTLPPNTALSRIMFTSETLNGSTVPASAFILWPWMPQQFSNISGVPTVGWAHGTSGFFGAAGPSLIRSLWYQYGGPYFLALQGYAVIGIDYAGLGVNRDQNGSPINFTYLAGPAHANDMFYAIQAAQTAFPQLSKEFVIVGHSEGGGVAYACAERQAQRPVAGHLGTVAGSPVTDWIGLVDTDGGANSSGLSFGFSQGIKTVFPQWQISDFLTDIGIKRFHLYQELQATLSSLGNYWLDSSSNQPNWDHSTYAVLYRNLVKSGGKPIGGPLLVLQGTEDGAVPLNVTTTAVNATCDAYPNSTLHYSTFVGVQHVPVMFAAQHLITSWIADRFARVPLAVGCSRNQYSPLWNTSRYQANTNLFLEYALQPWAAS